MDLNGLAVVPGDDLHHLKNAGKHVADEPVFLGLTKAPRERFRGGAMRYLPVRAVVYFHALKAAKLRDPPLRHKRSIWTCMVRLKPMKLKTIEFAPSAMLDLERLAADSLGNAERYPKARDRYITLGRGHPWWHTGYCRSADNSLRGLGAAAGGQCRR